MTLESVLTQSGTPATVSAGVKIAADALATGEIVQYIKLISGLPNEEIPVQAAANGLYVDVRASVAVPVTGTFWPATATTDVGTVRIKDSNGNDLIRGQQVMASSLPVVIASNQGALAVQGNTSIGSALGGNPVNLGAQAKAAERTVVGADTMVQLVADLVGKLIVLPYANPENLVVGVTSAIVNTTSTAVIAAQAAGVRTYVTSLTITNSHATVGTVVNLLDGTTVIWSGYAAAGGGGMTVQFPSPLRGTAATALNAQCVTTGASVIASVSGYKGV